MLFNCALLAELRRSGAHRVLSAGAPLLVACMMAWPACRPATASTFTVTNAADIGSGSLRQAILDANASPGLDTIAFRIPGPAPHTIAPASPLPPLLDPVVIDGTTQPDFNGQPTVQLAGANAGANSAFRFLAGSSFSTIRGLVIGGFGDFGIRMEGSDSNVVQGNFIGAGVSGTQIDGNANGGVMILNASGNRIGGTSPAQRNILSGGNSYGVYIQGSASTGNIVSGNTVGAGVTPHAEAFRLSLP